MNAILQDVRYALCQLPKSAAFALLPFWPSAESFSQFPLFHFASCEAL